MDLDRPHFRTTSTGSTTAAAAATTTTDLFICFTSRLSSSSMKLSKSILSPGRAARDGGPASLSSSLSRRLRPNGSLRGGQASPFFSTTGKKRGSGFDNPEPSSPKVTCIGQVRVKTKKKVKQSRSLSTRRSGGEVSFRKIEHQSSADGDDKIGGSHFQAPAAECVPQRNQRRVHLPISICEALSCLFPCRSSCSSTSERDKSENGCGAVFASWLVSVNDGEGGKSSQIELLVGGGDEEDEEEAEMVSVRASRRHVFDDIEVKDDRIELKGQSLEREDEAGRVSICIPPKNALLLMRCRSDPIKMASLANNRDADKHENEVILEEEEEEENTADGKDDEVFEQIVTLNGEKEIEGEAEEMEKEELEEIQSEEMAESTKEELDILIIEEEEVESNMSSFEALLDQESADHYEDCCPVQEEEEMEEDNPLCHLSPSTQSDEEESNIEQNTEVRSPAAPTTADEAAEEQEDKLAADQAKKKENQEPLLPECLLLMIREPKLSMEVSKETWVCTTDFMRWLPERPRKAVKAEKPGGGCDHEPVKRRLSIDSKPKPITERSELQLPPRSSCSLPAAAAASMATMIEQKLVNAVAYEPFVLTRCKSEPMRTAAVKLMPESCFWKNAAMSKLEPHRMGIGAAGVGF